MKRSLSIGAVILSWLLPFSWLHAHNSGKQFSILPFWPEIIIFQVAGLLLMLLFRWLFKNLHSGAIASSVIVLIGFSVHHLHKWLLAGDYFSKYIALGLCVFATILLVGTALALLAGNTAERSRLIGTPVILFLCISYFSQASLFIRLHPSHSPIPDNPSSRFEINGPLEQPAFTPDIYYIIPDGYGSLTTLRDQYAFDNTSFLEELRQRGFGINKQARANYTTTFLSLASCLNMRHLVDLESQLGDSIDRTIPYDLIDDSFVTNVLKKTGYQVLHYSSGWGGTFHLENADKNFHFAPYPKDEAIVRESIPLGEVLFGIRNWWYKTTQPAGPLNPERITGTLQQLKIDSALDGPPRFHIAHIICPHPPFLFGADGRHLNREKEASYATKMWFTGIEEGYQQQVQFINHQLLSLIDTIRSTPRGRRAVIILQADHGPSISRNISEEWKIHRIGILSAASYPAPYSYGDDSITSAINTFPHLFRTIWEWEIPFQKDKSYYSGYRKPYRFQQVDCPSIAKP